MVASAKSAVPTVAEQAAAMQLGQCAKNLATSLAELRTATQKVTTPPAGKGSLFPAALCSVCQGFRITGIAVEMLVSW